MPKHSPQKKHLWLGRHFFEVADGPKNLEVGQSSNFNLGPNSFGERPILCIDHPFETILASICDTGIQLLSGDLWKVTGRKPTAINKGDCALISVDDFVVPHTHQNEKADTSIYPPILIRRLGTDVLILTNGQPEYFGSYSATPVVTVQKISETMPPTLSPLISPLCTRLR